MPLQQFLSDLRVLTAVLVGLLGLTLLLSSTSRSWPYMRWLAGAALVFGVSQFVARGIELLLMPLPAAVMSVVALPVWAALMVGLARYFRPTGPQGWGQVVGLLAAATAAVLTMRLLLGEWPFAGPLGVSLVFSGSAVWLLRMWWRERQRAQLLTGACFLLHPALLLWALSSDMSVAEFRLLTPVPITIMFVIVLAAVMQRDARRLESELAARARAEADLQALSEALEDKVAQRTERLQEVAQGLRAFAGMVSHDLRGPLGNVVNVAGMAENALREGDIPAAQRWMALARSESMRGANMVNDLLALSQVDGAALQVQDVDLAALLSEVTATLSLQHPRAATAVQADALPKVRGDASLLRHVFGNLLGNALKFGHGHENLLVRVRAQEVGDGWRIELTDNGPGFDPGHAGQLFKPFARLAAAQPGTGLGLTIVRRAVERHGGSVGARAEPGRGATFWFTLPRAAA
jgi:signal transduction histidine kinase